MRELTFTSRYTQQCELHALDLNPEMLDTTGTVRQGSSFRTARACANSTIEDSQLPPATERGCWVWNGDLVLHL